MPKDQLKPGTHWPQGRKTYLHHPTAIAGAAEPWKNAERDFVKDRHVRVRPWAKGSTWRFEIRFDNLNELELGMLLYALNPAEGFRHKIGMGKPLGLGSVKLTVNDVPGSGSRQTVQRGGVAPGPVRTGKPGLASRYATSSAVG